jgi:hypothetical protein
MTGLDIPAWRSLARIAARGLAQVAAAPVDMQARLLISMLRESKLQWTQGF